MKYLVLFLLLVNLKAQEFYIYPKDSPNKIKKICKIAKGGDTIYLNGGIYKKRFPQIKCKGSKNAPVVITAKKDVKVTIKKEWNIKGRYITISNLNFRGNSDSLKYCDVIKQWWKPSKSLRQIGILINGDHITLKDNSFGYFTASGVKVKGKSDYITINHNIIYNNAWWTTGGTGGLVIKNIHQIDNAKIVKIKIINNLFFGNESRIFSHVFKKGFSKLTIDEGESFLLQQKNNSSKRSTKNGHYKGRFLVKNNLILYNGKGSSLNKVQRVDMIQNYLYCNGTTAKSKKAGGIRGNKTDYDKFINNYISSCKDRLAISVTGKHNIFKNNIVKSKTQKPMDGVKLVDRVFKDPKNLDFNIEANRLLSSFNSIIEQNSIQIKPTGYVVNNHRQIEDIIRLIPKKANTTIERYKNKIVIKNIYNRGIKGLGNNFILELPTPYCYHKQNRTNPKTTPIW